MLYRGPALRVRTATKPPQVKISSLTAGSKSLKALWAKKTATGYEVYVSTSSKFSSPKKYKVTGTTKTVSKLVKGKRYYVKVRAYTMTLDGKVVNGASSPWRSAVVK